MFFSVARIMQTPVEPDTDLDWLHLHRGKLDSNPDSDHLSHVDCDLDSNPDSGPGACVNTPYDYMLK